MKTINECLMMFKKDEQMEIAYRLGLDKLRQSARKADWAAHIEKGMLAEPARVRLLMRMAWIEAARAQLEQGSSVTSEYLAEHEELLEALVELEGCGLAWYEGGKWHIRDCVAGMLEMDAQQAADHHVYDVIADLIEGWLLHVGMMPLYRLVDWLVEEMHAEGERAQMVQQAILAVLIARRGSEGIYPDDENHLWAVHQDVEDPDALLERLREPHIAALDYPPFTPESLIFAAAYTQLPGNLTVYEPMKVWLEAHDADDDQLEDALADLVFLTQNDDRNAAMESVMRIVPPRDIKDAQRCCDAARQVINRIPLWGNKGHSAEALRLAAKVQRKEAAIPGRNDPCPCGSGKKYKQCCGKRLN